MTLTLRHTALAAAMGALAFAPANHAAALPLAGATETQEKARTLEELNNDMKAVNATLKRLTEMIDGRRDEKGLPLPSDPGLSEEVKRLRDRVSSLEARVGALEGQVKALKPSVTDPLAGKGTVRVVNEYPVMVSIRVNGVSHRVEPNEKKDILVPAGEFRYELLTAGTGETRSVIREKETVTLRIK